MPTNLETFWTDDVQAKERLLESYIMKQNEIVRVVGVEDSKIYYSRAKDGLRDRLSMGDASWGKFRNLPPLGWINVTLKESNGSKRVCATYLRRNSVRSRTHGIHSSNTIVYDFLTSADGTVSKSGVLNIHKVFENGSYGDEEPFPSFRDAFPLLNVKGSIALSSKFALFKDSKGLVTLYRKRKPVGLVPNIDSLLLFADSNYYREDIQDNHRILPLQIKEL